MSKSYSSQAFRWNIIKYVSGRGANAVASFAIFLWIAKVLPTGQYAVYVAAYSILEIMLIIFGLGMEWVTVRFVPVAKVSASGRAMNQLILRCVLFQGACLLAGSTALAVLAPVLSTLLGIGEAAAALRLYAVVMFIEGASRLFRDQLLSVLLMQGEAQASQMLRNLALLGLAAVAFEQPHFRTAAMMAVLECVASGASLVLAASFLCRSLYVSRSKAGEEGWTLPSWTTMLNVGRDAWIGNLANLSWGPQVIILLVARSAGTEATALLGFARNFSEYIRRYMPMEFLASVFRTFIIVRYATDKNPMRIGTMLGLAYKLNLLFLLPFCALMIVDGGNLLSRIGHGDYVGARWLVVGWLLVALAWAHHRISDLLAHVLDMSFVPRSVGLKLMWIPVAIFLSTEFLGLYSFFAVLFLAEVAYCSLIVRAVSKVIPAYRFDWLSLGKFFVGLVAAIAVLYFARFGETALYLTYKFLLAGAVGYIVIAMLRSWTEEEAALVSGILSRSTEKVAI